MTMVTVRSCCSLGCDIFCFGFRPPGTATTAELKGCQDVADLYGLLAHGGYPGALKRRELARRIRSPSTLLRAESLLSGTGTARKVRGFRGAEKP